MHATRSRTTFLVADGACMHAPYGSQFPNVPRYSCILGFLPKSCVK